MVALISSSFVFFFMSFVLQTFAVTTCPNKVTAEKGTNYSITCNADENINDFYWYKGTADDQDLVGKLENGIKSVSQRYKDGYDISLSGSMKIWNAGITHESLYTLVTFDSDGISEEDKVILNITIAPDKPCPTINDCTHCTKCVLVDSKRSGTLVCRIEGVRPLVSLSWNTTSQTGVSFVKYQQNIQPQDTSAESWNTSVTLDYEIINSCGVNVAVYCRADDTAHILNSTISTVEITNKPCNIPQTTQEPAAQNVQPAPSPTIIIVILIVVIVIVAMFMLCCILRKRRHRSSKGSNSQASLESDQEIELGESQKTLNGLVGELKKASKKQCTVTPLPKGLEIPISKVFTEFQCELKNLDSPKTSSELLTNGVIRDEKRVVFIAEHGFGRTTFAKTILQQWISSDKHPFKLVIFIQLKAVSNDEKLSEIVMRALPKETRFNQQNIEQVFKLKNKRCLVILDGLEDISTSLDKGKTVRAVGEKSHTQETLTSGQVDKDEKSHAEDRDESRDELITSKEETEDGMTIGDLLKAKEKCNSLHVWVTTQERDFNKFLLVEWFGRKTEVVSILGFSKEQISEYIHKCCLFYLDHRAESCNKNKENCETISLEVEQFLEQNKVFQDFKETPILINLMIHLLSGKYTSGVEYLRAVEINNITTLLRNVIGCMKERYLQNSKKIKDSFSLEEITRLENKLGEIAYEYNMTLGKTKQSFWEERIDAKSVSVANDIGFLKVTSNNDSEDIWINFYHPSIQEFFGAVYAVTKRDGGLKNELKGTTERALKFISELR